MCERLSPDTMRIGLAAWHRSGLSEEDFRAAVSSLECKDADAYVLRAVTFDPVRATDEEFDAHMRFIASAGCSDPDGERQRAEAAARRFESEVAAALACPRAAPAPPASGGRRSASFRPEAATM